MKKKGISLITLIITIVVVIILAAAIILTIGNNNPIQNARVATVTQTKDSIESGILMYVSSVKSKMLGELSTETILIDDTSYQITNADTKYIVKDGAPLEVHGINSAKAKEKLNVEIKSESGGNWYIDNKGKVYLIYDNASDIPAKLKDGESVAQTIQNFVTSNGGAVSTGTGSNTPLVTYTATYNANGGTGEMADSTGAIVVVSANGFTAPSGKVFKSWNTQADGKGTTYLANDIALSNLNLYAQWEKTNYTAYESVTITVGEETHEFWVLETSDESNPNVTLITKENINTTTLTQIDANGTGFSSSNYWWDIPNGKAKDEYSTENGLNVDMGNIQSTDGKHAAYAAQEYGKKVGGMGRLLLKSEADALATTNSALLYANDGEFKSKNGYLKYWLGNYQRPNYLYNVAGDFRAVSYEGLFNGKYGVRPVVTIEKSKI